MQISTLLLTGAAAAAALPAPNDTPKKPGWSYEVYYWNISNWRTAELDGATTRYHYGTCEGETTAESPDQSSYVDCAASRTPGDISEGGTFRGLSARVQPSPKRPKPDVAIAFQWTQQISNKDYTISASHAPSVSGLLMESFDPYSKTPNTYSFQHWLP
ncbi:hypothetical protein PG984_007838 [Apiospora sp. TS-2023a]